MNLHVYTCSEKLTTFSNTNIRSEKRSVLKGGNKWDISMRERPRIYRRHGKGRQLYF